MRDSGCSLLVVHMKPKSLSLHQNQPKASTHLEDVFIVIPPFTCTTLYLLLLRSESQFQKKQFGRAMSN